MPGFLSSILRPLRVWKLKREYIKMCGILHQDAGKSLVRQLSLLKSRLPGYTEEWYLEKIIYDLKRDRR